MAIEIQTDTIISIKELAEILGTTPDYMKKAIEEAEIPILKMNKRTAQQYVALQAVHDFLVGKNNATR